MQNPLQHFFTLVPSLVELLLKEKQDKHFSWEKQNHHNSKSQHIVKEQFFKLPSDQFFFWNDGEIKSWDALYGAYSSY